MSRDPVVSDLLGFWFGADNDPEHDSFRQWWFERDDAVDAKLSARFGTAYREAAAGELDHLLVDASGALALVLLLDQLPRNLFRGQPRAFATDDKARIVAEEALARGHAGALPPVRRMFLYLPFEHSEAIVDQERSVALFRDLGLEQPLDYAIRHRDVIVRFGRFPHRNAVLGRASTPEELAFLEEPGSSF